MNNVFFPLAAALSSNSSISAGDKKTRKKQEKLKETCQQFESILLADIWKKMASNAREISGKKNEDRPFGALEDLSVEMSAEFLSKSGGVGMGKMLYDSLAPLIETKGKAGGTAS